MKAGESPVAWKARGSPELSRYWKGKARRKSWSVRRIAPRWTGERTDETSWVSSLSGGLSHFEAIAARGWGAPGVCESPLLLVERTCGTSMAWYPLAHLWVCGCSENFPKPFAACSCAACSHLQCVRAVLLPLLFLFCTHIPWDFPSLFIKKNTADGSVWCLWSWRGGERQ